MIYTVRLKTVFVTVAMFFLICIVSTMAGDIAPTEGDVGVDVPVIMYHSILKDASRRGKYTVSPLDLEADLAYLKENGYTAVLMSDIIAFSYEGVPLPEKPVVLTFDDGHYNNYTYAYPLMEKYGMKFVISIVGAYTDSYTQNPDPNPNYAHLSWEDAKALQESGIAEIQNHTYNLHSLNCGRMGCKKKFGEDKEQYRQLLIDDIGTMQAKMQEHLGREAEVFTYPYGGISNDSVDVIRELGFKASLSCEEGINRLTGDKEELFMLRRCIRSDKRSVEDILKRNSTTF